ncbi:MAG: transcription termination factor NusA [Faecalibacterium sp.]|nr:transcription termination factor NusA [Ruminococcus sp.]MCM1391569.1 transcription termination factor NusA [Ruminococcus sp.]MCM1485126.1 transcription termination factor NusA [Faecalibacterium sp.]
MNEELFKAVKSLEEEKGISADFLFEKIQAAIIKATKNLYGDVDNVFCDIDADAKTLRAYRKIQVVDEVTDTRQEMTVEEAVNYDESAVVGKIIEIEVEPKNLSRIFAQTAKSVIRQGIREAERERSSREFQEKNQEAVSAVVQMVDPETGDARITIGKNKVTLFKADQLPNEKLVPDQIIQVYVSVVKEESGTNFANVSRKHPGLVKRLFEKEVTEISDGIVEIIAVSREAGSRTKMSVSSRDENVDAVGSCIGPKGTRVNAVIDALGGEKIDIINYSENPAEYIAAALAPSEVKSVEVDPSGAKSCHVIVPGNQLSLAIGNKGQNVRLAAKLTGWKIDIKPED